MVNILLVDDHEITRKGLKTVIQKELGPIYIDEAAGGDLALRKIKFIDYQLVMLDENIPGTDSLTLIRDILDAKPETNILMYSVNTELVITKKYLQPDVKGFLNKCASVKESITAITAILQNRHISVLY